MNDKKSRSNGHFAQAYSLETAEQTISHYKSWAKSYDREVGEENGYAQPTRCAQTLRHHLLPDSQPRILDAGCGSGLSGVALHDAGFVKLDGCDFSPQMLAVAREKNIYTNLFEADLNAGLPAVKNGMYDAITCVGIFSFGHVHPTACHELLRILKPPGIFVIALNEQYWSQGDLQKEIDILVENQKITVLSKEYGDHLPGHDVKGWVLALQKCQIAHPGTPNPN